VRRLNCHNWSSLLLGSRRQTTQDLFCLLLGDPGAANRDDIFRGAIFLGERLLQERTSPRVLILTKLKRKLKFFPTTFEVILMPMASPIVPKVDFEVIIYITLFVF